MNNCSARRFLYMRPRASLDYDTSEHTAHIVASSVGSIMLPTPCLFFLVQDFIYSAIIIYINTMKVCSNRGRPPKTLLFARVFGEGPTGDLLAQLQEGAL